MPPLALAGLRTYFEALTGEGLVRFGDRQVARRFARHNEPVARLVLTALADVVARVAGTPVKPAYAYFASYREGAELARHRDRAQCEYSISLLLDYEPTPVDLSPWPLWMSQDPAGGGTPLYQRPGDGILYRGCQLYHWRTALPAGHRSTHLFLHYVSKTFAGPLD